MEETAVGAGEEPGKMKPLIAIGTSGLLLSFGLLPDALHAQTGGNYNLTWNSIGAAGGKSQGGIYKMTASIARPATSPMKPAGGTLTLTPGFLQNETVFPLPVTLSGFAVE